MSVDPRTQSLFDAIQAANYHLVKLIVDSGVSVNSSNDRGLTPLALASDQGNREIVELLLAAGATMTGSAPTISTPNSLGMNAGRLPDTSLNREQTAQRDLKDFIQPSTSGDSGNNRSILQKDLAASNIHAKSTANVSPQQENWKRADAEATYTFDLDAIFDDSDRTLTSLNPAKAPKPEPDFEEGETYAIDLDFGNPLGNGMSMNGVEEGETYAIDLDFGNPLGNGMSMNGVEEGETYAIDLDFGNPLGNGMSMNGVEEGETYAIDLDFGNPLGNGMSMNGVEEGETYAIDLDFGNTIPPQFNTVSNDEATYQSDAPTAISPPPAAEPEPDRASSIRSVASVRDNYDDNATNSSLMAAVSDGDLEQVQKAIGSRSNPNRYDWELGYSPLGMAIEHGHVDVVKYLLAMGANPYFGSIYTTSLGLAAQCGETEIVQLLLKTGIDVNLPVNGDGWTALMCAVQSGDLSLVQTLVAAGANPNIWVGNETPILLAAKVADREIYNYIYDLVNPDLRRCADRDGEDTLQATLKRRVREQNRPVEKLIAVAAAGNVPEVQRAIELEVDIDAIGSQGHTALMAAAYYGHIAVIDTLLEAGANPNILSDGDEGWGAGMTALMLAAHSFFAYNRHEVVKLLVAGGAEIDRQGAGGKTALMYAALAGSGYRECVRSLIQAGADLNLRDDEGNTALMLVAATGNRELCNLLVQAGASTAGMESLDLIAASSKGDLDRVKQLLAQGGIRVNFDRGAALNNAAIEGHTEVVKLLLSADANVNLASRSGFTPLASAAYAGYGNIVRLLIQAGADPHLRTGNHRAYSPLEYAQMGLYNHSTSDRQHAEIIRLLEQLGAK